MCDPVGPVKAGVCEKLYADTVWYWKSHTISRYTWFWFYCLCVDVQFFILFSCHLWFTAAAFHTFSTSLVDQTSRRAQVSGFQHHFFFPALSPVRGRRGERVLSWGGGGQRGQRGGGNWLLQASREQDRWLDTGQSYTAKGCKRAMGKPCVCHEGTHALSHTDPHICTPLHPWRSRAHICPGWWEQRVWSKRRNRHREKKIEQPRDSSRTSKQRRL